MKLLCLDVPKPGASLEKYHPHLLDEARYGWQLYKSGIVRDIYRVSVHCSPPVRLLERATSLNS